MTEKQFLETDLNLLEKALKFHQTRIWPRPTDPTKAIFPYDNINPMDIIPSLKRCIAHIKGELKKLK